MAAVTISRSKDRLIAVKEVSAARSGEIEREAEMLKRLDHPGVVRFVDLVDTEDGGRALHTEFVSSDTWATRPLTDPADRAAGAAALAAVVADLHQMGVAHMQLTPAHVLHGDDDRPVLCGLSLAGEATADNRHADMAALADLCHDPSLERGTLAAKLASLADAARTGTLDARDLARRLDLLVAKKPAAADSIRAVSGGIADRVTGRSGRRILLAAGAAAVVVVAIGVRGFWNRNPQPAAESPPELLVEGSAAGASTIAANLGGTSGGTAADPASGLSTDPLLLPPSRSDGSGAVSVQDAAAVLDHGGRRYAVGATGDFVTTGDWDCDGQATVAIVRPSTGDVVLFDSWPGPDQTISALARWSLPSPTGAQTVANGSCDLLRVYTTAGSQLFDPQQSP